MANEFKVKNGLIAPTLQLTVSTGTAPLSVTSTTLNSNLNADLLDGNHASAFGLLGSSNTWTSTNTFSAGVTLSSTLTAGGSAGTTGQILTSTGTGVQWATPAATGASVKTSTTAPTSPNDGDLWFDENTGTLLIYWDDGTSLQWVQVGGGGGGGSSGPTSVTDIVGGAQVTGNLVVTGDVTAANFDTTSDARLKTNVEPITNAIDIIMQLEGVYFDKNGKADLGLIAQRTEKVIPRVVNTLNDEMKTKTVNYGGLVGLLVEGMKTNINEINELKRQLKLAMEIINGS